MAASVMTAVSKNTFSTEYLRTTASVMIYGCMFPFRQVLCPALIQLLGSPANDVSTRGKPIGYSGYPDEGRGARAVNGNGNKFPSPLIARSIYTIAGELVRLVGTLFSLRPTLESLFHRIILYPPPQHRIEALKVLKEVSCLIFLLITSNLKSILNSFVRKKYLLLWLVLENCFSRTFRKNSPKTSRTDFFFGMGKS